MNLGHLLIALAVVASWGIHPVIIKVGVMEMSPLTALILRFLATIVIFIPFIEMKRAYIKPIAIFAVLWPLGNLLSVFSAVHFISASSFIVISQFMVPIGVVLGWLFLKETVRWKSWLGVGISMLGILVIFGAPDVNLPGLIFSLGAALTGALVTLHLKSMKDIPKITTIVYAKIMALPVMLILSFIFETGQVEAVLTTDWHKMIPVLAYQALGMTAAMVAWHFLSIRMPISVLMPFSAMQPVFGVAAGIVFLNEVLTNEMMLGGVLVMLGVGIVVLRKVQKSQKSAT